MNETVNPCTEEVQAEVTVEELQEQLKRTEAERDEAQKDNEKLFERVAVAEKNSVELATQVAYLTKQLKDERRSFREAVRQYKRKRLLSLKLPAFLLALFDAFAIGVMVAMNHELIHPTLGTLVAVAAIMVATFCCGLIYERVRK